jgi:hypothetical protein
MCCVIEYFAGAIGTGNYSVFGRLITRSFAQHEFPYTAVSNAGGIATDPGEPIFAYKSVSKTYGMPLESFDDTSRNSPEEVGLRIWMNPEFGGTFQISGAQFQGTLAQGAAKTVDMVLYEGLVELDRVQLDCDILATPSLPHVVCNLFFAGSPPDLETGKEYFLVFSPNQADTNFRLTAIATPSQFDISAFPGGIHFYLVSRPDTASLWNRFRDTRPLMNLILADWTE